MEDSTAPAFGKVTDVHRQMASMCHFSALAGTIACGLGMPLGPLLIWLAKRNDGPFIDFHGKEAVNFQFNMWIFTVALAPFGFIEHWLLVLPGLVVLYAGIMAIVAGMKAAEGEAFRYPLTLRVLK